MPNLANSVSTAISRADAALATLDQNPFSRSAFAKLTERVSQYIGELIDESLKVASRHGADTVSAADVERASGHLVSTLTRRLYRLVGALGGVFFGTALSNLLQLMNGATIHPRQALVTFVFGVIGAGLVMLHVLKD